MSVTYYTIRQVPDDYAEAVGLAKYDRSRMPGCRDIYQAAFDARKGHFITGLTDEEAESLSNEYYDFRKTSKFWETFTVLIEADRLKVFDASNPLDYVSYRMLVANGYVAPSFEDLSDYKYKDALYYAYSQSTEDAKEMTATKKRDKAKALLLEIGDDKEKMLLFGQYLEGIKYNPKFEEPTLYKMLRAYIEDSNIENANRFISLFEKDPEELQKKIIVDKALKKRLIVKNSLGKGKYVYQYGQVSLGNTIEELYKNLNSIEFASELKMIQDELNSK